MNNFVDVELQTQTWVCDSIQMMCLKLQVIQHTWKVFSDNHQNLELRCKNQLEQFNVMHLLS